LVDCKGKCMHRHRHCRPWRFGHGAGVAGRKHPHHPCAERYCMRNRGVVYDAAVDQIPSVDGHRRQNRGIEISAETSEARELAPEVKLAQLSMAGRFALAPRGYLQEFPETLLWLPLVGEPLVRRTWTVWPASSRRRDLALLVAAMETHSTR
jgi:hypothetical protein